MKNKIRNAIFLSLAIISMSGCAKKPVQQTFVIACDSTGNPVLVTER